jgi:hypothetical protein
MTTKCDQIMTLAIMNLVSICHAAKPKLDVQTYP